MASGIWEARVRSLGPAVLTAAAVIVATLAQMKYASLSDNAPHAVWVSVVVVAAGVAAITPLADAGLRRRRRQSAAERVEKARTDQILAVNDALDPLVEKLAQLVMTSPEQQEAAADQLITQALSSVTGVMRPERVRVNYFEVEAAAVPVRVVCRQSAGRHTKPRTTFTQGAPDGDFVIQTLLNNETHFCADVVKDPPPGWDASRSRTYATFFSVPAVVGDEALGMLTVDAPSVGDLAEQDIPFVRVIGTVVAASLKIARGGGLDRADDST